MRLWLASFVVVAACSSWASFDLVLVADSAQGVVHRYDGDTGIYLGNFGFGTVSGARALAIDQGAGVAYVAHSTGYSYWNYFTGAFIGYNGSAGTIIDMAVTSSGALITTVSGQPNVIRYTNPQSGIASNTFFSGSSTANLSGVGESGGNYYALDSSVGVLYGWSPGSSTVASTAAIGSIAGTSKGAASNGSFVVLRQNGIASRNPIGGTAVFSGFSLSNPFTSAVEFAFGHPGVGWGLGVNASGTRLQRYFQSSNGTGAFYDPVGAGFTLSQVTTPTGIAVVVAPEPTSLIAIGTGLAMALRRRKRTSQ